MRYLLILLALLTLGACDRNTDSAAIQRPDFTLADTGGHLHGVSEWDGKVLVVNFWATWCPPCRREIPTFVALQKEYGPRGLQFVGLAMDDPEQVHEFGRTLGINYPLLVGNDPVYEAAIAYGNRAGVLPYSAIVDRQGHVVFTHSGELTRKQAEAIILPLL